ncbi:hypothetical protein GCM10027190_17080 [Spirosoma areae]
MLVRFTQRPHVVMATQEPLHTWTVGLKAFLRDVQPVAEKLPNYFLLLSCF